jgi:hypothetical protein
MSVNKVIRDALLPFGAPVEFEVFQGQEDAYFTFNYSSSGDDFGDDDPQHERYLVQVHYFCPLSENCVALMDKVKRALRCAGCTWPEVENASDEDGRHIVFECELARGVDM